MNKLINVKEAFEGVTQYFTPRIIGEVNDVYVKLAKVKGEDVPWHIHDYEDELFYIVKGSLVMQQRGQDDFTMNVGDLYIVPQGVEHRISVAEECHLILVENKTSKHTGDVEASITKTVSEQSY